MSARAGKRPLRNLTPNEKLLAIRRVHEGESKASVARDIGVPESTLRGWCKNENKITLMSSQSSPETDDSFEHSNQTKRVKLEEPSVQPFNLSLKMNGTYSPNSETHHAIDYTKYKEEPAPGKLPPNHRTETPRSTIQDKNKAEFARLSAELGLDKPETLSSSSGNLADIGMSVLLQWQNLFSQQQRMLQQNKNKVPTQPDSMSSPTGLLTTVDHIKHKNTQQERNDSTMNWYSMMALQQNSMSNVKKMNGASTSIPIPSTTVAPVVSSTSISNGLNGSTFNSSLLWTMYHKHLEQLHQSRTVPPVENKPILYQQLTREPSPREPAPTGQQNAENLSVANEPEKNNKTVHNFNGNTKARSVLDNLLFNSNNVAVNGKEGKEDDEMLSHTDAVAHGEKFLKWLEAYSDPSVTAMQIMQFRTLLNNVKTRADRKNGDIQNKTKVKRK